jgi:hypothetical protein
VWKLPAAPVAYTHRSACAPAELHLC